MAQLAYNSSPLPTSSFIKEEVDVLAGPDATRTAPTVKLYAADYKLPPDAPINAVDPPTHLVTPTYGYHVPDTYASGPVYIITRGLDIGIFCDWETVGSLVSGVSGSLHCGVKTVEEAHSRMRSAIDDGSAFYLKKRGVAK